MRAGQGVGDDPTLGIERRLAAEATELGPGHLVAGVVARPDERTRLDVPEPEGERLFLHGGELVGVVVALEREVVEARPEILADREDVDVDRPQRRECLAQLVARLAEADHQARLRVGRVADLGGHLLRPAQDVQAALPAGPLADRLLQAADRLEIVVEDVGPGIHHDLEPLVRAVEVGDQDLDSHPGAGGPQAADRLGEDPGAAVGQVVAGDAGDDDVLEAERGDRLGDPARLIVVEPGRPAGLDGAEPAGPGAGVAEDHDRRRALVPALPDVRAAGLLADRVQLEAAQQALELVVVVARGDPGADPVGMAPDGQGAVRGGSERSAAERDRRRQPATVGVGDRVVARRRVHRQLAGHGWECIRGQAGPPAPVAGPSNVARRPASRSRGANPSSRVALSWEAQ